MKLRSGFDDDPEINLTSLIDVVFLLLIFFMVTTTFDRAAMLKVELPEASDTATEAVPERLELIINEEGRYFINNLEVVNVRVETLKDALVKQVGQRRDMPVVLRADARTPHQSVVTAMDAIGQLGFTNLSIATTRPGE